MVHETQGLEVNALTKYDAHFKRPAAKITHIKVHLGIWSRRLTNIDW